jgi:hypothetical protein
MDWIRLKMSKDSLRRYDSGLELIDVTSDYITQKPMMTVDILQSLPVEVSHSSSGKLFILFNFEIDFI